MDSKKETAEHAAAMPITEGVIWKRLLLFFFPLLAGTFFQLLYNTVDAIIVGQFCGKAALSAVGGATATLINVFVGFFIGITSGVTVVVSQFYGAGRKEEVRRSVHTAMGLALAGGVLLNLCVFILARSMLVAMNTPADTLKDSLAYLCIYSFGMTGNMVYNMGASILRAAGDSKRPFYFLVAGTLTNVFLDLFMVVTLKWGVAGASLATILSQYISAVLVVRCLCRSKESYHLDLRGIRIEKEYLLRIIRIGIPAAMQSLMYSFSNVLIQTAVNSFGTDTVAAWTVWGKIDCIFWMIINSLGIATTAFVGQNYGAGKLTRVRKCARQALFIALLLTVGMSTFFRLFRLPLMHVFTGDENVIELGRQMCDFMAPCFITYICIEILSGTLRGMGDAVMPTIITVVGVCVLRAVWIFTALPKNRSMITVMCSYPFSWIVASVWFFLYYESYVKKHRIL
ncbi:MAG: MATE family efflux transporter [Lachnospiraceae bacterium]|nr:MATE family efflux transporter [Lachnospiraceae bacterium]